MVESQTVTRGVRKSRTGVVVSKSGDKSVVVKVEQRRRHPLYGKVVRSYMKLHAHDEKNEADVGCKVRVMETRPVSKLKRWRVTEILEKREQKG